MDTPILNKWASKLKKAYATGDRVAERFLTDNYGSHSGSVVETIHAVYDGQPLIVVRWDAGYFGSKVPVTTHHQPIELRPTTEEA